MFERTVRRLQARFHFYIAACVVASAMAGCANNPIAVAETAEQKVYATYGSFVIAEGTAELLTAPASTLDARTRVAIVDTVQRAQPIVDSMLKAFREYQAALSEFQEQHKTAQAFQVVVDNLQAWIARASPLVEQLKAAVKGGG